MSFADRRRQPSKKPAVLAAAAIAGVLGTAAATSLAWAENWPGFRGADGQSVSTDKALPVEFGADQNLRWRVKLPGPSNGSPIVWGDRVFVNQADKDNRRTVMCFDRADGKLLWQQGVTYAESEQTHPQNPPCSGTPVTDGERVIASFGSAGLYCYDLDGKELWHRDLGKLNHMFGNAVSPIIAGDLVVLNFSPGEGERLVAVNKKTGEVAWEVKPPQVDPSERTMTAKRLGGPGMMIAMPMTSTGDKDQDGMLSREEMKAVADNWYGQFDVKKEGKLTKEQLVAGLDKALASPMNPPGFSPGKIMAARLFRLSDEDKNASMTRAEWNGLFERWFAEWSGGKGEELDGNQVLDGFNAVFPPLTPPPGAAGGAPAGAARGGDMGGATGPGGSWSTPILIHADNRDELIVTFANRLVAFDPTSGKELWMSKGLTDAVQPSPIFADGVVVAASGDMAGGNLLAVKPGGGGDVTESHRLWRQARVKGSTGTGVIYDGHFYYLSSDGFAVCLDMKSGKKVYQKRLDGGGATGESWSSMLLADEKIYVPNQSGDVFVMRASPKFELLATNSMEETTNSSLAASDGELFMRTNDSLWCFGKMKK